MSPFTSRSGIAPESLPNRSRPRVRARIREQGAREQGSGVCGHHLLSGDGPREAVVVPSVLEVRPRRADAGLMNDGGEFS